ncbi:hypothetical protein CMV_012050 [Castanea mollissima]|uniref:Pentatricopeptide repeat-containing protein n=1 Tax=Castanea mollissima TaxID=60419 RepID=A0A8J4R2S7_9ROSI|nr:hypothetical protein CMV_012050 [Castanea mollissima]
MAYHLCSSPSSLFHDRQPLCNSLSSPPKLGSKTSTFTYSFKPTLLPSQPKTLLQITHVSIQDPIPQETQNLNPSKGNDSQCLDGKSGSSSKNYIWINPKSSRASQLCKNSYDARYASLVKMAESLNSCSPNEEDVVEVLRGLEIAYLALRYFQQRLKLSREVILYNVTLKVFRKCRDFERAEKLFDEMLERGVKPVNTTFSTMITCARLCSFPHKAVEWVEKMPSFGCVPDGVTHLAMIDAYGRAGNVIWL